MKGAAGVAALAAAAAAAAMLVPFAQGAGASSPSCEIQAALTPAARSAQVLVSQPVAVTFYGNYSVSRPNGETARLFIDTHVSTQWASTVFPSDITVGPNDSGEGNFSVTVVVPAGTLTTPVGELSLNLSGYVGTVRCTPKELQAVVVPLPFFCGLPHSLVAERDLTVAPPDETATLHMTLSCWQDVDDPVAVRLRVEGPQGMASDAPPVISLSHFTNISMEASLVLRLDMRGVASGDYDINIGAVRNNDTLQSEGGGDTVTLHVPARPFMIYFALATTAGASLTVLAALFIWQRNRPKGGVP